MRHQTCFNPRPASGAKASVFDPQAKPWVFQSAPRERGERCWLRGRASRYGRFNPRPASGAKARGSISLILCSGFQSAPRERGESPLPEGIGRKHFSTDISRTPLQRLAERKYGWGMVRISPYGDWGFINRETSGETAYACGSQNDNSTMAI